MKKEPNKKVIGLYLVVGFTLFLLLIGKFILQTLREDKEDVFVMYFRESIQGLSEGSPVVFRGVEVGRVIRIRLMTNKDEDGLKFQIPVYVKINPIKNMDKKSMLKNIWDKEYSLRQLIHQGLRARLATQSYLTGQLRIELVILPNTEIEEVLNQNGKHYPQIPTVLSKSEELTKRLDKLELQETIKQFNYIADILRKELPNLMPETTKSMRNLNRIMSKIADNSEETIINLNKALQDISEAAKSLQNLTDYLEQHPEALIKGKKGE